MYILADLHTHFYPSYNYTTAISHCFDKFTALKHKLNITETALFILALTERYDCNFYQELAGGKVLLPDMVELKVQPDCIVLEKHADQILVFPGRQFSTKEKIELLSLGSDQLIPTKAELFHSLDSILAANAVPVINWAPGKWWFKRGSIIRNAIKNFSNKFVLGDTSLRPRSYPRPCLMGFGEKHKRLTIYGSDPLPHPLEQNLLVSYISCYQADFDLSQPLVSFRKLLFECEAKPVGMRSSWAGLILRLWKYYDQSK